MTDTWEYTDDDGVKYRLEVWSSGIAQTFRDAGDGKWKNLNNKYDEEFLVDLVKQLNAQKAEIKQLKKEDHDLKERCFGIGAVLAMQNAHVGEVSRLTGTIKKLDRYRLDNGHMRARIGIIRKWCESKDTVTTAPLLELINAPIKVEIVTDD